MAILMAAMLPAQAQVWDFTGNNLLNGAYVFRELITVGSSAGSVSRAITVYGTITFTSATGRYSISANAIDSSAGSGSYTDTGAYSISPNGYGFMDHLYWTSGVTHGLVSNGIFIGKIGRAHV